MPISVIANTAGFPYRAAVSIYVRWSGGAITRGSGILVGPNDVLTAAHMVRDPSAGTPVSVIPNGAEGYHTISVSVA